MDGCCPGVALPGLPGLPSLRCPATELSSASPTTAASADRMLSQISQHAENRLPVMQIPETPEITSRPIYGTTAGQLQRCWMQPRSAPVPWARPGHRQPAITASLRCREFNRTSFRLSRLIMPSIPAPSTHQAIPVISPSHTPSGSGLAASPGRLCDPATPDRPPFGHWAIGNWRLAIGIGCCGFCRLRISTLASPGEGHTTLALQ